jgi:uncharacterized protein YjbJ (UPF0337 family)
VRCRTDRVPFEAQCLDGATGNIVPRFVQSSTHSQETLMNKDQTKGRIEEAKGRVKEVAGKILGDKGMQLEGNVQKNVGKVQSGYGDLKDDLKTGD